MLSVTPVNMFVRQISMPINAHCLWCLMVGTWRTRRHELLQETIASCPVELEVKIYEVISTFPRGCGPYAVPLNSLNKKKENKCCLHEHAAYTPSLASTSLDPPLLMTHSN